MRTSTDNHNRAKNSNAVVKPLTPEQRNQIFFSYLRKQKPGKTAEGSFSVLLRCMAVHGHTEGVRIYLNICSREELTHNLNILADFASRMCERGWEAMTDFIVMATGIMDEHNGSEVLYV